MPTIEPILNYKDLGFSRFLEKRISSQISESPNATFSELNFDQVQTTGSFGDILQIGAILIDGQARRIVVKDANGNDAVIIGEL